MKKLIHNHFFALLAWVVILVLSLLAFPNVNQLTREHSQITLPQSTQSQIAQTIEQKHWGHHVNNTYQVVAVFNNGDQKMSAADRQRVQETVDYLRKHQAEYGIKAVMGPNDNAATRKQLISKDQTTQLVQLNISKDHGTLQKINRQLSSAVKTNGLKTYVTGADILNDDFSGAVQQGIKKTEVISVIFIFIVLLIVFRSPITPLISLLMVGISFLTSFSIVTNLVDKFNFPFSNFTQVFMIIVLFGIGTDYDILLYNQFKENLGKGMEKWAATKDAQKRAGRTILYSGSSLLIGFTSLGLARFSVYQSAVGVAIGVAVLLIVLLTLNPFFMAVLGKKMFWPDKRFTGESSSKLWRRMANGSVHHPVITLLLVFAILLPVGFVNHGQLNYNDADEISNSTPSKKGFNVVEDHFSKGTAEPVTIYIKSSHKLDNERNLLLIDRLTNQLKDSADVKTVTSVTQPAGTKVSQLYVNNQLRQLTGQLGTAQSSLSQLSSGMAMQAAATGGAASDQAMVAGMGQMSSGLQAGGDYLSGLQKSAAADSFYLPNNQRRNPEFQQSVNNYLSADKKTAKLLVILNSNPSASRATSAVDGLTKISKYSLKGTALSHATVVVGGQSSKINDTKTIAGGDFLRTAIIMIVGIGLALVYVTRSLLQPVYVLGTLVTAYMASLSITHLLTRLLLGRTMLTWNTPFFSFIMLIALGVDYSIFLIMRYRNTDNHHYLPTERIVMAASAIGTVVISAAVILSGTFASLIPSGIPTLIEVAMTVVIGLIILVIIIPLVVPSTIHLTYPMRSAVRDNQAKQAARK
ncbi:MMPL family transporter [Limosilactobacillus antri]|uniref:MMPL family protein n=1 Tax=Limosilactobacillus antri DSM 16041 TaxID=525309 RepID=C8P6K3_9LACO|nr:MMPL family transporter [Limosilactobacillus antri]EEW53791.1 MMPL family protein [Limosilactobacillus antri DSM 16041]KRK60887.1 membrane protein [Limosilactobacillus antri DSM 16041]